MTDTEPPAVTDEMVEAAARAMFEETYGAGEWKHRDPVSAALYRLRACVAAEAALAASPKKGQD